MEPVLCLGLGVATRPPECLELFNLRELITGLNSFPIPSTLESTSRLLPLPH